MENNNIGIYGMGVMGKSLARNFASKNYKTAIYNYQYELTKKVIEKKYDNISGYERLIDFVNSLEKPRRVWLMIKAGDPVDMVISSLIPLLDKGDIIIDGGNSLYTDTIRRTKMLEEKNLNFIGAGVSGGEEGALKGPAIMPGGSKNAWKSIKNLLTNISAKVDGEPCCKYIGPDGAGHFVKMVHNGIEYGDMQLICEAYDILKANGFTNQELADTFSEWNQNELSSYLIEITANIFKEKDTLEDGYIVDKIKDQAGQKGTGRWTLISANEIGSMISTISSAVDARIISSWLELRKNISTEFTATEKKIDYDKNELKELVKIALYSSKIISYAQGIELLKLADKNNNWNLNIAEIASIWRGGCIIRAAFLNKITDAYQENEKIENLLLSPYFKNEIQKNEKKWRKLVALAITNAVPCPAFSASIAYFDSIRSERLPANLLQAQRDYFGAHTFKRLDKEGTFHHDWPPVID